MSDKEIRSDARIIKAALDKYPECDYFSCDYVQGISTEITIKPHTGPVWNPDSVCGPSILGRDQLRQAASLLNNPW